MHLEGTSMSERLIFESSVAALIRISSAGAPELLDRFRAAGVDAARPLLPAYPAQTWARLVLILAEGMHPSVTRAQALKEIGRSAIRTFGQTPRGKAALDYIAAIGPVRHLERMSASLKTGASFIETQCKEIAPGRWELWINDVSGVSEFYAGMIEEGSQISGGLESQVRVLREDKPAAFFEVTWASSRQADAASGGQR
jgi:uncharacterized protein (TIGR02265 family)